MPPDQTPVHQHTPPPYLYTPLPYSSFAQRECSLTDCQPRCWSLAGIHRGALFDLGANRNYMKDITLAISGMSCGHCLNAVNQAINAVANVEVKSVKIGRAEVRVPDADPAGNEVKAAIERAGYKVEGLIAG